MLSGTKELHSLEKHTQTHEPPTHTMSGLKALGKSLKKVQKLNAFRTKYLAEKAKTEPHLSEVQLQTKYWDVMNDEAVKLGLFD